MDAADQQSRVAEEWYDRECRFCTREAALVCPDAQCREDGMGEPHAGGCPAIASRVGADCTCVGGAR